MEKFINHAIQEEALINIRDITEGLLAFNVTYQKMNEIATIALKESGRIIRFYEIKTPNYALIKAKDIEKAGEIYKQAVSYDVEFEIKEVSNEYALVLYSLLIAKNHSKDNGRLMSVHEVLDKFRDANTGLLLIDKRI